MVHALGNWQARRRDQARALRRREEPDPATRTATATLPSSTTASKASQTMQSKLAVHLTADMDYAPTRQPVRDEFSATLSALLNEDRIVVGHRLVERHGRGNTVFVEHREHAEYAHPVAIFVVAVA